MSKCAALSCGCALPIFGSVLFGGKHGGKLRKWLGRADDCGVLERKAAHAATDGDIAEFAALLRDGKIKATDLKKAGLSPEDIADIQKKAKQLRPREHDAQKIIDDFTGSENALKNALERVRQNPRDRAALRELEEAQQQVNEIRKEFSELRRGERGG
jgi:hypothetical protein